MNLDAYESATKEFNSRYQKINWKNIILSHLKIVVMHYINGHPLLMN